MRTNINRVGTTYIPVKDPRRSSSWYQEKLGAVENYLDEDKAIVDFAGQSFFLVKAMGGQQANFIDAKGQEHFSLTFEVNGFDELKNLHNELLKAGVDVRKIEDRGHPGNNFVFSDLDGNLFDVWSVH
ncbi:VOC family protein [Falsibacillus albus]|uniref:VOC family protein n=1 Tax=Falsibacillus albus TaxID=2478915 RepID=A0A3L7JUF1_9BACI|nr:VOC family protein [Falsibacillus albus]RLQ94366.1 VOC family protein [Falsibacillus albus]